MLAGIPATVLVGNLSGPELPIQRRRHRLGLHHVPFKLVDGSWDECGYSEAFM